MKIKAIALSLALTLPAATAQASVGEALLNMLSGGNDISSTFGPASAMKAPTGSYRPPETFQGQWFTAPNGCSYSRAQAPGYPPSWHLILNPHHIGQKPAHSRCAAML